MYHISKDARAQKSAQLICKGLEACLAEKPLNETRVSDIYEKCFVSRSTFYRLFDSVNDVISYQCECIFQEVMKISATKTYTDRKEQAIACAKAWLSHPAFIRALVDNGLGYMIYKAHERHFDVIKEQCPTRLQGGVESKYFLSILSAIIAASMSVYIKLGSSEPIEKAYDIVTTCTSTIAKIL